jgi:hypothetical protein
VNVSHLRCAEGGPRRGVRGALLTLAALTACKGPAAPVSADVWPGADRLFHAGPRWLAADGAYSVDLGGDRSLWLFGDTLIARAPGGGRADALFIRNSVAVQTGRDPSRALIDFAWGAGDDGGPRSFLDQDGHDWFWPGGGARVGDRLLLFWGRIHAPAGDPHGYAQIGWRALVVDNPDDPPATWASRDALLPADSHGLYPGSAALHTAGFVYAYAGTGSPPHDHYLVRWPEAAAAAGDLRAPEWWCAGGWSGTCAGGPAVVVANGAPELSVHADGRLAPYVMVQSEGFGAATLALRTAPAPEGPWSDVESFFRPPEWSGDGLYDSAIYAGKAHPELAGADLIATYVPTLHGVDSDDDSLYIPHFVRITYP